MDLFSIIQMVLSAFLGGFGGWFWGRKKYNAEVKSSEIQNFDSAIEAYKKLYDDREKIYQSTIESLNKRVDDLTEENKELRRQVMAISNFITSYVVQTASSKKKSVDVSAIASILKDESNN